MHLQGAAFDISMANHDPDAFEAAARAIGFTGFGFYPRQNFMHIDTGRTRQWGDPFPPRANRFAAEPQRLQENLTESRTMKGGGAAGVATLGAAGVEVVQQAVSSHHSKNSKTQRDTPRPALSNLHLPKHWNLNFNFFPS